MGFFDNLSKGLQGFGQGFSEARRSRIDPGGGYTDAETGKSYGPKGRETLGSLFDTVKSGFTDDKGLFQGGKDGRFLGRYQDFAEKTNQGGSGFTLPTFNNNKVPNANNAVISGDGSGESSATTQEGETFTTTQPDGTTETVYSNAKDEARTFMQTCLLYTSPSPRDS